MLQLILLSRTMTEFKEGMLYGFGFAAVFYIVYRLYKWFKK